jgi:type II restriction enzyme
MFSESAVIKRKPLAATARRAGWVGCNIALNRVPADARIALVITRSSPAMRDEPAPISLEKNREGQSRLTSAATIIVPPEEVREKFRRVKPLKDIPITQRGWTLDVLNIVRRLVNSEGRAPRDPNIGKMGARITRPSDSFTTADVYAFERELEKLHPDNRHVRDNPVKDFVSRGKNSPTTPSIARFGFVAARRARRLADSVIIWPVRRMEPPSKLAEQSAV